VKAEKEDYRPEEASRELGGKVVKAEKEDYRPEEA